MKGAVIVAGGSSTRFGTDKLDQLLFGKSVLAHSVDAFVGIADKIVVVGKQVDGCLYADGGQTRSQSVQNGLAMLVGCDIVAVHDGARPFVTRQLVQRLFCQAEIHGSAVPSLPVTDTLWQVDDAQPVDRQRFATVQTPQVFNYDQLVQAFGHATQSYTDESSLYFATYGKVNFVQGDTTNTKITYQSDLPQYRVGVGYDVHQLVDGNGVILGGVTIPFDKKLLGHSDADVLAHAVCDAVLSASGHKDIGHQFPVDDDAYLGADSMVLLSKCISLALESGYCVVNLSAVVMAEQPKLYPHIDQMAQNLAKVLGVAPTCVNLSATTTETLGIVGQGKGIAAQATVLLVKK